MFRKSSIDDSSRVCFELLEGRRLLNGDLGPHVASVTVDTTRTGSFVIDVHVSPSTVAKPVVEDIVFVKVIDKGTPIIVE